MQTLIYKYRKFIYIISMILFALLGTLSVAKVSAMLVVVVAVLLSHFELRPLRAMDKSEFVVALLIEAIYISLNFFFFQLAVVLLAIGSFYFVIHTVDISYQTLSSTLQRNPISSKKTLGKISTAELIAIALTSIAVITIFSTSSPFYAMNYWNDSNIFFTVGRGMTKGLIPYKDMFEQKGPWFLFMYAISAFISFKSFIGVYIFEIVACFIFTLFIWKTVHLFYEPSKSSIVLIPLGTTLTYLCTSFHFGGGTEEFCIPLLAVIFYIACKAEAYNRLPSVKEAIVIGILTGFVLYSKYTICGFVFGYIMYILYRSIKSKEIIHLLKLIGGFICGILLVSLPVAIYFIYNNALNDFIQIYFYDNIFAYSVGLVTIPDFFSHIFDLNYNSYYIQYGIFLSLLALCGMKKSVRTMYSLILLSAAIFMYLPGRYYFYYVFAMAAVTIPGYILLSIMWDSFCSSLKSIRNHIDKIAIGLCLLVVLVSFATYRNLFFMGLKKDELPQFQFGKVINQTPDAKVLTYDIMDFGFYFGAETVPSSWYFCFTNMNKLNPTYYKKLMVDEIENNTFDYIITQDNRYEWSNYEIIATSQMRLPGDEPNGVDYHLFYLYQRVS